MKRLAVLLLVVVVTACASRMIDLRSEVATAALLLAAANDQGIETIETGEVPADRARAIVEASNAGQQALEGCRLVALDAEDGTVAPLSAYLCLASTVNAAIRLEGAITGDDDSDELEWTDALSVLASAILLPDDRMVALLLEIEALQPGERLPISTVNWAMQEMRESNHALRMAAQDQLE